MSYWHHQWPFHNFLADWQPGSGHSIGQHDWKPTLASPTGLSQSRSHYRRQQRVVEHLVLRNTHTHNKHWLTISTHNAFSRSTEILITIPDQCSNYKEARVWQAPSLCKNHAVPYPATVKTVKNSTQNAPNLTILNSKIKKIFWRGHSPFPDPDIR